MEDPTRAPEGDEQRKEPRLASGSSQPSPPVPTRALSGEIRKSCMAVGPFRDRQGRATPFSPLALSLPLEVTVDGLIHWTGRKYTRKRRPFLEIRTSFFFYFFSFRNNWKKVRRGKSIANPIVAVDGKSRRRKKVKQKSFSPFLSTVQFSRKKNIKLKILILYTLINS